MTGSNPFRPPLECIDADLDRAYAEDLGAGDATAGLLPEAASAKATLTCREPAVLAGAPWFDAAFRRLDPAVRIRWHAEDGDPVAANTVVCELEGIARALVSAERTALNFLQLLSGTATTTAAYVRAVAGTRAQVLDTRKTVPGLRLAQKYAVRCGGGGNHRMGLYDAILVKENHVAAAGGIAAAVAAGRRRHPGLLLEVEVENLDELAQAIAAGADRVMLDDFEPDALRDAVASTAGRVPLEVSGSVALAQIGELAASGVDFISVGALTKHVRAIDFSLRLSMIEVT